MSRNLNRAEVMGTTRTALLSVMIALTACLTPVVAPKPVELSTTRAPAEVVRVASAQLTAAGFEITTIDASAGVLTARRARPATEQGHDIACRFTPGSLNDSRQPVTLAISLSAVARDARTVVTLGSRTTMRDWKDGSESSLDCASSGTVERHLAEALSS